MKPKTYSELPDIWEQDQTRVPIPRKGVDPISWAVIGLVNIGLSTSIGASIGVGTLTTIAQAVVAGAVIGGTYAVSAAFGGAQQAVAKPESTKRSYELEDGPRFIVLGRARVGGVYGLRNSTGFDTYRLLYGCQGQVDGIEEYFVNGRLMTVDENGEVSSPPYDWADANYLKIYNKDGSDSQTAFSQLISAFPDNWTSAHRGRGVMATVAKYTSPGVTSSRFLKIFPNGFPEFDVLVRGPAWYDPRDEATRWSDNGVLGVLHLLTSSLDDGGQGLSLDYFDMDDIADQADLADASVSSLSGSEVRSKCSGSYTTDTARGSILGDVLLSTGTQIVRLQNGKHSVRLIDDNPTSTVTFRRQDIKDVIWGGSELVRDANQLALSYLSPERNWQIAELGIQDKSWAKDADSITATGKRTHELTLNFCPQSGQAQRIGRRVFNRMRSMKGEIITGPSGFYSFGHVTGTAELDVLEADYEATVEIGSPTLNMEDQTLNVPVTFLEPLSAWNAATDEVAAPIAIADIEFYGDLEKPNLLETAIVERSGTNDIRIRWDSVDGATGYEAIYRDYDGSIVGTRQSMTEDNTNLWAYDTGVSTGERYLTQVRAYNSDLETGAYSVADDTTLAFDTAAPTGCTVTLTIVSEDSPVNNSAIRVYRVTAFSTDLSICQIDVGDGYVYVRPYEEVTKDIEIGTYLSNPDPAAYDWLPAPTGSVTFRGGTSSGSVTTETY